MTNKEFSSEFDVLYNSITSNQAPGLDSYEKSVILSKAQEELLKAYLDPRGNKSQEGLDSSAKRQIDFSKSIDTLTYDESSMSLPCYARELNAKSCILEDSHNILAILNESLIVSRGNDDDTNLVSLIVTPLRSDEYDRLMSRPFKRPLKNQAWRIVTGSSRSVDLISGPSDSIQQYNIRYVKRPLPIILEVLDGDTIEGLVGLDKDGTPTSNPEDAVLGIPCELDPTLHKELLQRAVELAKAIYMGDLQSQLVLGQTSQTDIGVIPTTK